MLSGGVGGMDCLRDGKWEGPNGLLAQGCGHGWSKFIPG